MEVKLRKAAIKDIEIASVWLEEQQHGHGLNFKKAILKTIESIGLFPTAFRLMPRGYRYTVEKKYRYYILFGIRDNYVDVFQVVHTSRDRTNWKSLPRN